MLFEKEKRETQHKHTHTHRYIPEKVEHQKYPHWIRDLLSNDYTNALNVTCDRQQRSNQNLCSKYEIDSLSLHLSTTQIVNTTNLNLIITTNPQHKKKNKEKYESNSNLWREERMKNSKNEKKKRKRETQSCFVELSCQQFSVFHSNITVSGIHRSWIIPLFLKFVNSFFVFQLLKTKINERTNERKSKEKERMNEKEWKNQRCKWAKYRE